MISAAAVWVVMLAAQATPPPASTPAPPVAPRFDDIEPHVRALTQVYAALEANAAEPVDADRAFYQGALPVMLRRLDPHSVFLDPDQFEQLKEMEKSERKGFGSVVSVLPGRLIVLQTLPGTPSARSGLAPGDEILAINNIPVGALQLEQLVQLMTESRQRPAKIHVRKPSNVRLFEYTLIPETLAAPSVDRAWLLQPGIGYVRATSFDEKTGRDIGEAIEKLGGHSLKGLVLDLRDNPGGVMTAALETAALFLKPGETLMSVRGRRVQEDDAKVPAGAKPYTFPVSVLVNGKSASASEIVAGALQDHDRATILGEPSFGKGLVQSVYPLSHSAAVLLTTAYYFTPSGRSIQKALADSQIEQTADAREYKTDAGRLVKGGGGIQPDRVVYPEGFSRLRAAMEASGSFTNFATEYTQKQKVAADFEVTPAILDDFRSFLTARSIQPGVAEWIRDSEWTRLRLKQEIVTIALGVSKGDEIEVQRDPVVRRAVQALGEPIGR